ncbi:M4 family metallopeptidase [Knoellia subterranea]|uniref:Neutral metalloproteinase n=1 Tax=Knoellia subterranea KCTC 19937 TaxID=1385521 RepID=A0A0A0JMT9_9MICO|nr:M4 family metallopeptidase [Knoellia subterranea]KGN38760.1 peptidase [Knoellia subterranea KCTC 19937]
MFRRSTGAMAVTFALALPLALPLAGAYGAPAGPSPAPTAKVDTAADHAALGLSADEKLVVTSVVTDPDGTQHIRYNRTFKGLRVIGGDLVLEKKNGSRKDAHVNASGKVAVASTTPRKTEAQASSVATANARKASPANVEDSELVVWAGDGAARLAYEVITEGIKADQTPTRLHTLVDADTGAILQSWDDIKHGSGSSMYSGTVTLNTIQSGSSWLLKDSLGNHTTDLNGSTSGTGTQFTDADNVWGNGSSTSRQTAGVDAQYGAEKTYAYYNSVLGRRGIWNNGTGARSRVHYGNSYVNAFWDGTQMTYGDGSGNTHPLTSIDVAAHEMSHGVTENTANLNYSGDAGGLNEATSDIFGAAVEFYANSSADVGDYLIGEKININGNGTPLRYMDKPSKDGSSPDCWSTNTKNLDPHYSSGALNHWFYMASEGSGAKTINGVSYNSPTCGGAPAVTGAGRSNIEKVWYRTLSTKLTSSSNYAAARNGAIASAKELYGATSQTCKSVEAAFNAISVPAGSEACDGGTTPPPTGGNLLQNPGFESGAVNWTGTSGPVTNNSGRPARTGSWKLWLGGNGSRSTETINQSVAIPSTATAATLSFWLRTDTAESGSTAYDTMKVQIVDGSTVNTLATYTNVGTNATYTQKSFNVAAYKGKTVTVRFLMNEDSSLQTSFVVDDTALATS